MDIVNNFIKVLIIIFTVAFSIACGLLLVRFAIPIYFKLFSPIGETLRDFYIVAGVFSFLVIILDIIFFKMGKYNWCVCLSGTAVLFLGFGIPIFMLENNIMLWDKAVLNKSGPVFFIEFSDQQINTLKYCRDLFSYIWDNLYPYVYTGIGIYLGGYLYLRKRDWRIKGVRIKF